VPLERRAPGVRVDVEEPIGKHAEIQSVQQGAVPGLGDDDLAIAVLHVTLEFSPAPSGVDADDGGAGEGGGAEQHRVFRDVVEQDAHVKGAVAPQREQQGGALCASLHVLAIGPASVFEEQGRGVVGGVGAEDLGDSPVHDVSDAESGRPGAQNVAPQPKSEALEAAATRGHQS